MKVLIVVVLWLGVALSATTEKPGEEDGKIINGVAAGKGQFPWQVGIFHDINGEKKFCGGALISDQWVLTAAHCVYNAKNFEVILGATSAFDNQPGKISMGIEKALYHPNYNYPSNLNNDVAVIKLRSPVQFSNVIKPIKLAAYNSYLQPNTNVYVSGWGQTSDQQSNIVNTLYYVNLWTISNQECKSNFNNALIQDNVVCCDGSAIKSTCYGDSGGPLITYINNEWIHCGVVSFVDTRGCARGYPSGYARTASFLDFIYSNTGLRQ